jgi:hypothetical protein
LDVVVALAIPLAAIAAVGWVITSFRMFTLHQNIEHLQRSHEAERSQAAVSHSLEIELVKQAQTIEREELRALIVARMLQRDAESAHLRGKQAEVVAELYQRLARVQRLLDTVNGAGGPGSNLGPEPSAIVEVSSSFLEYFDEHRLWLHESLCCDIAEFEHKVRHAWNFFASWATLDPTLDAQRLQQKRPLAWRSAWYTVDHEIPELRARIEAHMRQLLANSVAASELTSLRSANGETHPDLSGSTNGLVPLATQESR